MENAKDIAPINEDLNVVKFEVEDIKQKIYTIRGKQVMLDRDLAELYKCKNGTKAINQAVKRNLARFPERFMFQLSQKEYSDLRSQIGTTKFNIKSKKYSICIYRTRSCNACYSNKNKYCSSCKYKDNGCIC